MKPEKAEKQKVLIVEDTTIFVKILQDIVKDICEVVSASSAKEALDLLESGVEIDLILMDVVLPDMNGYDLVRLIKNNGMTRDIPVIFITGLNGEQDEEYGLKVGAIDYITKPFSKSIVKARIKNHLELKRYRDVLRDLSMLDGLTGLNNRRRFNEYMMMEWKRASRSKSDITVLLIDIDHFKLYNDQYGHLQGDECLKKIAKKAKEVLNRPGDFVARWGGEEFVCILPETDAAGGVAVAQRFRKCIYDMNIPNKNTGSWGRVTVSIGVAHVVPDKNARWDSLIQKADEKLYEAKEAGRNMVSW
jgi:diguanylate cyclase (GGDEF)-like protein